ncbi:hypothetical protein BDV11DRAFT_187397 [Aspergillus similis]
MGDLAKYSRVIEQVNLLLRIEHMRRPNTLNKRLTENFSYAWRTRTNSTHPWTTCSVSLSDFPQDILVA